MNFIFLLLVSVLWNNIDTQKIKKIEDFEQMQQMPKEQFAAVVNLIKNDGKEYPGVIVSGVAVVTTPDAQGGEQVIFCLRAEKEEKCIPVIGDIIVDEKHYIAYVKVFLHPFYSKQLETMIYKGDLADVNVCVAVSFMHDPIMIKLQGSTVEECRACDYLDAVICDLRYVGVLLQDKQILRYDEMLRFTIEKIGDDTNDELWTEMQEQMQKSELRSSNNSTDSGTCHLGIFRRHVISVYLLTVLVKLT
ncbi:hypothetical protein Trydic_g23417 [Trypoxylus dichotomus]